MLPDSVRTRHKASSRARFFAKVLRTFGTNFADWGTREFWYATPNAAWNEWKENGRPDESMPGWKFGPSHLQIWRLDNHLWLEGRTRTEKLYVTTGGLDGLALFMPDVDGHEEEHVPHVLPTYRWLVQTYFHNDLYDEGSDRGHHGYCVMDRSGATDREFNRLAHLAHHYAGPLAKAENLVAPVEIKGRITEYDHRHRITKRGGLFALPNLPDADSLARFADSTIHDLSILERIIHDGERLPVGRVVVPNPDPSAEPKVAAKKATKPKRPRGSDDVFVPTSNDPFVMRREAAQWKSRQLGRPATKAEALAVYNPLRPDDACDSVRERKMQQAVDLVASTFDASKRRPKCHVGPWEQNEERISAMVKKHITREVFEETGDGDLWGKFPVKKLEKTVYALEVKSYTKENDPDLQFTFGVAFIQGVLRELCDEGVGDNTARAFRRVLVASGLAEMADSRWRAAMPGAWKGISKKLHIGPAHPGYGAFNAWADAHNVHIVKVADLPPTDGDHPIEPKEDITTTNSNSFPRKNARSETRPPHPVDEPEPAVAVAAGRSIQGAPE